MSDEFVHLPLFDTGGTLRVDPFAVKAIEGHPDEGVCIVSGFGIESGRKINQSAEWVERTVTEARLADRGNRTVVTLDDGTDVWYCHQSRIAVSPGTKVTPGQVIGYTGSTGNVTGPHLHLEIHPGGGSPVDPESVLRDHGVTP